MSQLTGLGKLLLQDNTPFGLAKQYIEHYPTKFQPKNNNNTPILTTPTASFNNINLMLQVVAASPFPIPTTLIHHIGLQNKTDIKYVQQMFSTQIVETGYHYSIAHNNFKDWKWWKEFTTDHAQTIAGEKYLYELSLKWKNLETHAEQAYAAKYLVRYYINVENNEKARALILDPKFLMIRATDPEGLVEECEEEMFEDDATVVCIGDAIALGSKEDARGRDGNLHQDYRRMLAILHGHLLGISCTNVEIHQLLLQLKKFKTEYAWWCPISATMEQAGDVSMTNGHTEIVRCVSFSKNGHSLVSGSADQTIRVWNTNNGSTRAILKGHTTDVYSVSIAPNGTTIASGGGNKDSTVRIWNIVEQQKEEKEEKEEDVKNGDIKDAITDNVKEQQQLQQQEQQEEQQEEQEEKIGDNTTTTATSLNQSPRIITNSIICQGHSQWIRCLSWNCNQSKLASASGDRSIIIWNGFTGEKIHVFEQHTDEVTSICFSPNGALLISCSLDETICLWNVENGTCLHTLKCEGCGEMTNVRFSNDGEYIICEGWDKTIHVWDCESHVKIENHLIFTNVFGFKPKEEPINLRTVVPDRKGPVGISCGVYARHHVGGGVAVAQDFERIHFLKLMNK